MCAGRLPVWLAIPGVGAESKREEGDEDDGEGENHEFHDVGTFW